MTAPLWKNLSENIILLFSEFRRRAGGFLAATASRGRSSLWPPDHTRRLAERLQTENAELRKKLKVCFPSQLVVLSSSTVSDRFYRIFDLRVAFFLCANFS